MSEGPEPPGRPLEVGVGLWTLQSTAAHPRHHGVLARQLVDDARLVESLGFDSFWLAEHHFWYDGWCPAPLVAAASAAAATERLRFGTAMLLLPQRDPLRVARTAATLDRLWGGRLDLGVGLGHRDPEFDGFGIERRHRGERMDEALDVLRLAWSTHGTFEYHGRHFDYPPTPLDLRPVQQPHPPVWVGGMAGPALDRAVRHGAGVLLPQTLHLHEVEAILSAVRDRAEALGVPPVRTGILKDAWVTEGDEGAAFADRVASHYREEAGSWWLLKGRPAHERPELLDRQMDRIRATLVAGAPDSVATRLSELVALGIDTLVVRFEYDVTRGLDRDATLALFASEVLPRLRAWARQGSPSASVA